MPLPPPPFGVIRATAIAPAIVRVEFSRPPRQSDVNAAGDALNPTSWSVTGATSVGPLLPALVEDEPKKIDLYLTVALTPGTWAVTSTCLSPQGLAVAPAVARFAWTVMLAPTPPVERRSVEREMTADLPGPFRSKRSWKALVAALATGGFYLRKLNEAAYDQLSVCSAKGRWLGRRGADRGVPEPSNVGMGTEYLRDLIIRLTAEKVTQHALQQLLEVFYGPEACRGWADTLPEPFALFGGEDLSILIDERVPLQLVFDAQDFATPGVATAREVAVVLTRTARAWRVPAFAVPQRDPATGLFRTRAFSGSLGVGSSIRFLGGRAQNILQFPQLLATYPLPNPLPTWQVTLDLALGQAIFTAAGNYGLDLTLVEPGDYVNLYGTEFVAANRGTFRILDVAVTYPLGVLTQVFKIENRQAVAQAAVAQLAQQSVLFFRPERRWPGIDPNHAALAVQGPSSTIVTLPATSRVVSRTPESGSYLHGPVSLPISSVVRIGALARLTVPAHGLSTGAWVEVRDGVPSLVPPPVIPGDLVGPPLKSASSPCSILAALAPTARPGAYRHTLTALADGRVLLAGGVDLAGPAAVADCELFAPGTRAATLLAGFSYEYEWQAAAALPGPLFGHAALKLPGPSLVDQVLVSGGNDGVTTQTLAYLYQPAPPSGAGTWVATSSMGTARRYHAMALLPGGDVLVAGGENAAGTVVYTCERYVSASGTWTAAASMGTARHFFTLVALPDGRLLAIGGFDNTGKALSSTELYDPSGNSWSPAGRLGMARADHAAQVLPDGRVLVVGGRGYPANLPVLLQPLAEVESFDPILRSWGPFGRLPSGGRAAPSMALTGSRLYVFGDVARVDYLDLGTGRWDRSIATGYPATGSLAALAHEDLVLVAGGGLGGASVQDDAVLLPALEQGSSGCLNRDFRVTVIDANILQVSLPDLPLAYSAQLGATLEVLAAQPGLWRGPFLVDPRFGLALTAVSTTLDQDLLTGLSYPSIKVVAAGAFPDQKGWLCLGFGTEGQETPLLYLARLSLVDLQIDLRYVFSHDVLKGADVMLLLDKGPVLPPMPDAGGVYLTASSAGRIAGAGAIDAASPAGLDVDKVVLFPGDRGLGGASLPAHGVSKLSDKVIVWGGDDLEEELAAARGTP